MVGIRTAHPAIEAVSATQAALVFVVLQGHDEPFAPVLTAVQRLSLADHDQRGSSHRARHQKHREGRDDESAEADFDRYGSAV